MKKLFYFCSLNPKKKKFTFLTANKIIILKKILLNKHLYEREVCLYEFSSRFYSFERTKERKKIVVKTINSLFHSNEFTLLIINNILHVKLSEEKFNNENLLLRKKRMKEKTTKKRVFLSVCVFMFADIKY